MGLHLAALLDDFQDGVFAVSLALVTDPALVISTITQTLGIREASGQPVMEALKDYLRDKRILLMLDNFEQVLDAVPLLWELLSAAPGLKLLVTSRAVLRLSAEHEYLCRRCRCPTRPFLPAFRPTIERFRNTKRLRCSSRGRRRSSRIFR